MLPIQPEVLKKYTRAKIELITGGFYEAWTIGIGQDMKGYEDEKAGKYSFPCLSHDLARELMSEFIKKGMTAGKIEKKGISISLRRN